MKHVKILGLAGITAVAIAACIPTSASGAVLCKTKPNRSGVCEGEKYPANTPFSATSASAVLTVTNSAVVKTLACHSEMVLKNTAEFGSSGVPGEVTKVSFDSCKTNEGTACDLSETGGYTGELAPTGNSGNGTLTVHGSAEPRLVCGGFLDCKYKLTASGLSLSFVGGNPGTMAATEQELALVSGFGFGCGTGAKWDATYNMTGANSAVWVATA